MMGLMIAAVVLANPPAAATTLQARYDQAQAAYDAGDWARAADGFAPLLMPPGKNSRTDGVIRTRYANALMRRGQIAAARSQAERAVGEFAAGGTDIERSDAYRLLGEILRADLALDAAVAAYEHARDGLPSEAPEQYAIAMGQALSALAFRPEVAIAALRPWIENEKLRVPLDKDAQGQLFSVEALALVNAGRRPEGVAFAKKAIQEAGTLSTLVSPAQAQIRNSAGLVFLLGGDKDTARKYLAFSGSGFMPDARWLLSNRSRLPVCGEAIRPDDVAVVEFAVDDRGNALGALPIYVNRPGEMGTTFASAVREWHFDIAGAKLNAFWRRSIRVALRCISRPEPEGLAEPFANAAGAWLASRGVDLGNGAPGRRRFPIEGPPDPDTQAVATLLAAAKNKEARVSPVRLDAALVQARAPLDVRAFFAGLVMEDGEAAAFADKIGAFRAAAWLWVQTALNLERHGKFPIARPYLVRVTATPTAILPANDPIRLVAMLHLSMIDRRAGDAETARVRLVTAGITPNQCAMFDVSPIASSIGLTDRSFPQEAMQWGFEGVTSEDFDIDAEGRVGRVRTVISYPPFVFDQASEGGIARSRFVSPTLDGQVLGCSGYMHNIRFSMPDRGH